jgi:Rieske Fe-S protein
MSQHESPTAKNMAESSMQPVSRRRFAKYLGIGAIVAALGAVIAFFRGRDQAYPVTIIGQIGEIPVGGSKVFAYPQNDRPCFLLRPAEDRYIAFSRLCTHHGCPTFFQPQENVFNCPCHGGVFSAQDGRVLAGPPPKALPQLILERRGDAIVATGFVKPT